MDENIRGRLFQLSEEEYRKFSSALTPGETQMLGVRLPELRMIAKEIAKGDFEKNLYSESTYFEEKMLKGMIIGYATMKDKTADRAFAYLEGFISEIDNWSVCDSFCNTFKVARNDLENSWNHIQKYLISNEEFEVRTGLILILNHFIKCDINGKRISRLKKVELEDLEKKLKAGLFEDRIVCVLNREFNEGYYSKMAAAWTIAEMFVTFPKTTYELLLDNKIDDETFNKAIQKICESLTPSKEVKDKVRALKRK